jgi:hypothetical protein
VASGEKPDGGIKCPVCRDLKLCRPGIPCVRLAFSPQATDLFCHDALYLSPVRESFVGEKSKNRTLAKVMTLANFFGTF